MKKDWGKTTRYFIEEVIIERPYLKPEWIDMARKGQGVIEEEIQNDGRIRKWIYIKEENKYLRVVFLEDRETVHNAFFDRNFKEKNI